MPVRIESKAEKLERLRKLNNLVENLLQTRESKKVRNPDQLEDRNLLSELPRSDVQLYDALYECFLLAKRGKGSTVDEFKFEVFWEENLKQLTDDIIHRRWKPSSSKTFITPDPVFREIFAAMFRDRIVHHFLYAVVAPWWNRKFVADSYSCRRGRGTDYGVRRMQKFMLAASDNGRRKAYVLKGDISGYFMHLDRKALYQKVMVGLKKQFPERGWLFEVCEYLWKEVIFDDPCLEARIVGSLKDWENLPADKSLFNQPEGVGIVIGNLTSQLLSNIMLNEFDWHMKKKFGFPYYGRYVDDFFIVVREEEFPRAMKMWRKEVPEYLKKMGLRMHPKKIYVQEVSKGCPFLGKMVRPFAITPGKRYLRNMRRAFWGYVEGTASYETMQSYVGMGKNMAAYSAMRKTVDEIAATVSR